MSKTISTFLLIIASLTLLSCNKKSSGPSIHQFPSSTTLNWKQIEEGLEYAIVDLGTGDTVTEGSSLKVYYTAWYLDAQIIDSNKDKRPHRFKVGQGRVIKGWEKLIPMINKGGKIYLKLSHEYAFGNGKTDGVRPFSSIYFGIEIEN